jgi:pimeloyl-ACP methyl ester carboxylesterase
LSSPTPITGAAAANGITLAYESFGSSDYARGYDPAGYSRQATAILVDRYEPAAYRRSHLATITAPTVILHGAADPLVPAAAAEDLAALIPGAELRIIPGLGHDLPAVLVPEVVDAIIAAATRAAL